jgi:hypothetical protein
MPYPIKILFSYSIWMFFSTLPAMLDLLQGYRGDAYENNLLGSVILGSVIYCLVFGLIYIGLPQYLWRQVLALYKAASFNIQGNRLRQAKQLFDEGLLTEAEYQSRLKEIKSK